MGRGNYDNVPDSYVTHLHTSQGIVQCTLRKLNWHGCEVVNVQLYRQEKHLESTYTAFCAGVYVEWKDNQYKICQPSRNPYTSAYWQELEKLISNIIVINE